MEIQGLNGVLGNQMYQPRKLTDDQKEAVLEIVSRYNAENFSDEDKKAMMEELKSAGLPKSREVGELLREEGFDIKPPEGGPQGMPAMRPGGMQKQEKSDAMTDAYDQLKEILEKLENGELDEESLLKSLNTLRESFSQNTGNLVDILS